MKRTDLPNLDVSDAQKREAAEYMVSLLQRKLDGDLEKAALLLQDMLRQGALREPIPLPHQPRHL
jgi:hypothetical protein